MTYFTKKIVIYNIQALIQITQILKKCGDDMYFKYGLSHWKNSYFKTFLIVIYTAFKHSIDGVFDGSNNMIATFQTKCQTNSLHFSKLAVSPKTTGKGIGSYCLSQMECLAKKQGLQYLKCEVYDKSKHAYDFYIKRGFVEVGKVETLKYTELILEKRL